MTTANPNSPACRTERLIEAVHMLSARIETLNKVMRRPQKNRAVQAAQAYREYLRAHQ